MSDGTWRLVPVDGPGWDLELTLHANLPAEANAVTRVLRRFVEEQRHFRPYRATERTLSFRIEESPPELVHGDAVDQARWAGLA